MKSMIKHAALGLFSIGLALGSVSAVAGDSIEAGKIKTAMCAGCHGANGISGNDLWPNLAGQKKGYLAKQIKAFKDGDRKDPMMNSMVQALSDQDIKNVAAYYSSLK
jgi:cytochrome c553